jgi:uncharacterized protein YjdB
VLLALAGAASGCGGGGDGPAAPTPTVQQLSVSPTASTIQVGQSAQFAAAVVVTGTASSGVTWSLSNPSVGTVTANGNSLTVVGSAVGSTDVVATSQFDGTRRAVASLTVVGVVQGITVTPPAQTVAVGGTVQITANVTAIGASTAVIFTSSNSSVASVEGLDASGRVVTIRGRAPGTATITARAAADTSKVTTATVTVTGGGSNVCSTGTLTGGIVTGQTVTGALTTSDCDLGDGSFADIYTLTISTPQAVQIDLTSTAFDAYLILIDGAGNLLAADDDGGGGTNARVRSPMLAPGTYYIAANSIDPGATGAYSLSVRVSTAAGNECTTSTIAGTIAVGQTINGALTTTDCTLGNGSRADLYTLTLATSQAVQIDLTSTAFDAYIIVYGATGNIITGDDNSGGGTNARVSRTLAPGTYYVAATAEIVSSLGAYTITIRPPTGADAAPAVAERTGTPRLGWAGAKAMRAVRATSAVDVALPLGKPRPRAR